MSIVELAEKTNLSARRVRNILDKLIEGRGVNFSIRWNTAAAGAVRFFMVIEYDPRETEYQKIVDWLQDTYNKEFWLYWVSTNKPIVFASFTVGTIEEVRRISIDMFQKAHFRSIDTWICYPPKKFQTYPSKWLDDILSTV